MGDRAYKIKKPVDLGFLDFSTRARREFACRRELAVNRRIAPDVYLGVATVDDPDGKPCEHVLVMRRMPDDRRLSRLVRDGVDVRDDLRRLACLLAAFHSSAPTSPKIASYGSPSALEARWRSNLDRLGSFHAEPELLERVSHLAFEFIAGRRPLLEARMAAGLVRDGHGDLLADDVFCLADGPRALDAMDFDDRLRWLDVLDDVACLAMDLERLGAPALGQAFLDDYAEFSGAPQPPGLVHHYTAYRAVMRAMVAAIYGSQHQVVTPSDTLDPVHRLLEIGKDHLTRGRVRLVVVGGGPASGKTTLAQALADRYGLAVVSSDRVRKEMLGLDPQVHRPAAYEVGIYRPEVTERTYRPLADRAERLVGMGESVVVDATFAGEPQRALFRTVADRTYTATTWVRCRPPDDVVAERLRRRADRPDQLTDADAAVAAQLERHTAAWAGVVEVDTSRAVRLGVDVVARAAGLRG